MIEDFLTNKQDRVYFFFQPEVVIRGKKYSGEKEKRKKKIENSGPDNCRMCSSSSEPP
jgi:hypothetical protein